MISIRNLMKILNKVDNIKFSSEEVMDLARACSSFKTLPLNSKNYKLHVPTKT